MAERIPDDCALGDAVCMLPTRFIHLCTFYLLHINSPDLVRVSIRVSRGDVAGKEHDVSVIMLRRTK